MVFTKVRERAVRVAVTTLLASSFFAAAESAQRTLLPGHRPAVVPGLQPLGRLEGSTPLKLSINLPLRHRELLANFIETLYDSASPGFRRYLTPEEFDARFGPSEQDYQAALDWAANAGFTVAARHPNRMLLEINASVADIERALSVTLRSYAHPTESRSFFAPDTEPSVAIGVPRLLISGLDNFARPHPKHLRRALPRGSANATPKGGSGPNGNLAGFDYRAVYAPGVALTGTGQMVGLVEFDGYYSGDITAYENQTGLPSVPLQKILLDGFNGIPTTGPNSGNGEVALDIEMAISMAPGLSKVVVFEADPNLGQPNDILQAMSTNLLIKQFSCSWEFGSVTPAQRTAMDAYFMKFAAQGQSFFDASGDYGATTGAIGAPDDDPYVTVVGGTTLATAGPRGAWLSETVWNAQEGPGVAGSGGGVSSAYAIPLWQQGVNLSANQGSTSKRNIPDVAMVADNIFIVADAGQQEFTGGTSVAAPLWAGFAALANQQAASAGLAAIGFINPALYQIATNSAYAACFDDITVGNNTNANATQYFAAPGYDLCTGWGSPSGGSLIIALTQPDGFQITPGRGAVANGPIGGPFTLSTQTFSLANAGKAAFDWTLQSTSTWLSVSGNSGSLAPNGGSTAVSLALNSAASLLPAGVYTANLWFTNLASQLGQLRQFTLQVGQDLAQDGGFEAGDFTYYTLSGDLAAYTNNFADDGSNTGYTPHGGYCFAALGQVSTLAYLSQPMPTRAAQTYLLSFWLNNPSGATPNQFLVQWNSKPNAAKIIFNQINLGAFGWTNMQFLVQATTNLTTLQFGFRNDVDDFCLDDVSVLPVPTPALQALPQSNGAIELTWTALPGVRYQAQYTTDLAQTQWTNLGSVIPANTNRLTLSDNLGTDPRRFYRVALLP